MIQMNLFTKQKQTHREDKVKATEGEVGGINWELGTSRYKLLHIKQ